jgi:hypothetical protein
MGDQKIIYPVGDSHAWHVWLKIPEAAPNTVGPMTMYHFGTYKPMMLSAIPSDAIVCFCWGEIDCRCHVFKHPPAVECINELVRKYRDAISENVVGREKKKVWVYNVVPPPIRDPGTNPLFPENPAFPFLGTDEQRLSYVKLMNELLRKMCYIEGWTFVNIYDKYADAQGFLNMAMSDGHVHLADEVPLKEFIRANT